ncbi:mitochondrial import inner membrane translocase subunit TIM50 [Cryptococcus neoformans]|nr:mitochondrial import inner membrane translocase subunit TIM50 [Cryptococcus neoformans var. grubii]OXC65707.1 mitochondrial import inner membrane translocase subunit TIM50 [Cryptococcus neoformans var. grubii MW-RSA852]UOH79502.1 mitochondrial import inner membrane translocase subunit TIM50 [Cryptococcus neoformans]
MLRQATSRFLSSTHRSSRPLSTSAPSFIRIRSQASEPSPAERPPPVPENVNPSQPFEPEVNKSEGATKAAETQQAEGAASAGTPLTPPQPEIVFGNTRSAASTTPEMEANVENPDYSKLPSLDIDPEAAAIPEPATGKDQEAEGEKKKTGAGKKEYVSSQEKSRRMWIRAGYGALAVGAVGAVLAMGSEETTGKKQGGFVETFQNNMLELFDFFNKPAFQTLLPDPLPPPHQRPYTLCIDLEGLLVHSSWDRTHGWRTAKRPGVDYFLGYLSQFYEIVLFSSQPLYTAAPIAEKIDPYQAFMPYRLFRESTRSVKGKVVKDISFLNRDPSKVIVLDVNPEHVALQPENGIVLQPWDGSPRDKGLVDMIPFLESIGIFNPADVRPILQAYAGKDIPIEYAKKEAEAKAKAIEEWERTHPTAITGAGSGFLSSIFGSVAAPGSSRPNQPMTYLEQKRAQAQRIYQEEQKYWAEHADEFKKLIEEDKQRQLAEMKGSILGYLGAPKMQDGPKEDVLKA